MLLELLVQIISEPCFNILRTKEQLGYIVFSGIRRSNGVQGLRVIVQSERHPSYVDQRVEAFLTKMEGYIADMTPEEFEKHKEALAAQRLERPKKLSALSVRFWSEITSQQYNFDRTNIEVAHLRGLQKEDILAFFRELIHNKAPRRHKLAVHVVSVAEGGAGLETNARDNALDTETTDELASPPPYKEPKKIENITYFKSSHGMFPLVQPYININTNSTKSKL